jgi:hypothetical protein
MSDTTFTDNVTTVYASWLQDINNFVYRKSNTVASTSSAAGLSVPHGVAPNSPVNGDIWSTTAGLYVRINGATVGPLGSGGGGGGVTSFNSRTGAVTLSSGDVTTALGFTPANSSASYVNTLNSKTGSVSIVAGTNITVDNSQPGQVILNATGGAGGVTTFNTRTGAVTLTSTDVTNALTFTPVNPSTSITAGTGLTGGGDLSTSRTLSVANDTTTQKVDVLKNGTAVATRKALNFIEGLNTTLTVADNSGSNRIDITVASTGGGGGVSSFNTRTGAVTLTSGDVTSALTFTPYNSTNPSGYISGITSGMVTTALGYTPVNPANGTFTGRVFGNNGGNGLGQIVLTTVTGTPTGGSNGDFRLVY